MDSKDTSDISNAKNANWTWLFPVMIFIVLAIARLCYPGLGHGDDVSDGNTLVAGQNFARNGFIAMRFLPEHIPGRTSPEDPYTHVPPLSDNINGLLRATSGFDNLVLFRAFPLAIALGGLVAFYIFLQKLTRSRSLASFAAVGYTTQPYFLHNFDSVHQHAYSDAFLSITCLMFLLGTQREGKARLFAIGAAAIAFFLQSITAFDYIIATPIILLGVLIITQTWRCKWSWIALVSIGSAGFVGLLLHLAQNAWFFGSWSQAFADITTAGKARLTGGNLDPTHIGFDWSQWFFACLKKTVGETRFG